MLLVICIIVFSFIAYYIPPGAAAGRSNPISKVRGGGGEEISLVQGKEQWLRPRLRETQERR